MTTLHMDVETVRNTQTNMTNAHSDLTSQITSITNSVAGMVGSTWQGNSANEFQSEFDSWRSSITGILDKLNELSSRLGTEITEWEQMAAKLN